MARTTFDAAVIIMGLYETYAFQRGLSLKDKMIKPYRQDAASFRVWKIKQIHKIDNNTDMLKK